jgi:peptidoglycan hydrolase-like protein with peptidoglycan-binding domain
MPVATMSEIAAAEPASPVLEAQQLLTRLGFNVGEPDGKMGTRTHNAIRLFQLQSGLQVTGELTPELLEAMRARSG